MSDKPERKKYPSELADRYPLRLPDGLMPKIKASAKTNNRTVNAEIVSIIESAFAKSVDEKTISSYISEMKIVLDKLEGLALYDELRKKAEEVVNLNRYLERNIPENEIDNYVSNYKKYLGAVKRYADSEYDRIVNYGNMDRHEYIEELRYWETKEEQTKQLYEERVEEPPVSPENYYLDASYPEFESDTSMVKTKFTARTMNQDKAPESQDEGDGPQSRNPRVRDDLKK